ncbi:hypothetical protein ACSBR2_003154 [Camellia fascicularis]
MHGGRERLITAFVDNLSESIDPKGLFILFNKFGVVRDVFIPNKRRRISSTRFGFVRYDYRVAANVAIQKANGLWVDDRALKVKEADFNSDQRRMVNQNTIIGVTKTTKQKVAFEGGNVQNNREVRKTFAEVLTGKREVGQSRLVVKTREVGNAWLYGSVIIRLHHHVTKADFKHESRSRGVRKRRIRDRGGRDIVITFSSTEEKAEGVRLMQGWLDEWGEFVLDWKAGMHIEQERCTWLSCYGVPLNLWSAETFTSIGRLWGEVVGLDEDIGGPMSFVCSKVRIVTKCMETINAVISLESNSGLYPVGICEEQLVFSKCMNLESHTSDGLHSSGGNSDGVSVFGHGRNEGEAEVAPNLDDAVDKLADVDKA